ncbi:MAG: hypothetical protein GY765_26675, partial [bacterium]|nr:hypothetical protein [bacterium]
MINIIYSELYKKQAATAVRIIEPLQFLARNKNFSCTSIQQVMQKYTQDGRFLLDNPDFQNAHILYLFITDVNNQILNHIGPILNYFLQKGKAVITNLDDHYFHIPDSIVNKKELQENLGIFRQLVSASHLVLATGKVLKDEIARINPRVAVVPNMIDPTQYPAVMGGNQRLHIGWCGLASHFEDLSMIIPAMKKIMDTFPVDFTLFGLFNQDMKALTAQARNVADQLAGISDNLKKGHFVDEGLKMVSQLGDLPYGHEPAVSYAAFPVTLSKLNFDIGLCPLRDTLFNRCKSAIKFAQYAAVGAVTVASDVYPY